jgi:hypothetical protein
VISATTTYSTSRTAIPITIAPALAPADTCGLVALGELKVAASVSACMRDPPGPDRETTALRALGPAEQG